MAGRYCTNSHNDVLIFLKITTLNPVLILVFGEKAAQSLFSGKSVGIQIKQYKNSVVILCYYPSHQFNETKRLLKSLLNAIGDLLGDDLPTVSVFSTL